MSHLCPRTPGQRVSFQTHTLGHSQKQRKIDGPRVLLLHRRSGHEGSTSIGNGQSCWDVCSQELSCGISGTIAPAGPGLPPQPLYPKSSRRGQP